MNPKKTKTPKKKTIASEMIEKGQEFALSRKRPEIKLQEEVDDLKLQNETLLKHLNVLYNFIANVNKTSIQLVNLYKANESEEKEE